MLNLLKKAEKPPELRYNYDAIDKSVRNDLIDVAVTVRREQENAGKSFMTIGKALIDAKGMIDDGTFTGWAEDEFGFSIRTAQRFMAVSREFEGKEDLAIAFGQTVSALLAAPSTPEAAKEIAVQQMEEDGKPPSKRNVEEIIKAEKSKLEKPVTIDGECVEVVDDNAHDTGVVPEFAQQSPHSVPYDAEPVAQAASSEMCIIKVVGSVEDVEEWLANYAFPFDIDGVYKEPS